MVSVLLPRGVVEPLLDTFETELEAAASAIPKSLSGFRSYRTNRSQPNILLEFNHCIIGVSTKYTIGCSAPIPSVIQGVLQLYTSVPLEPMKGLMPLCRNHSWLKTSLQNNNENLKSEEHNLFLNIKKLLSKTVAARIQ
jgi:hypothetical protein